MTTKNEIIETYRAETGQNLRGHYRTDLHSELRSPSRDYWTEVFECYPEEALERAASLLDQAVLQETGCLSLGSKTPAKRRFKGRLLYVYQIVHTLQTAMEFSYHDVVRHTCHNRLCIRPDHLLSGTRHDNYWDEAERRYIGLD